MKLVAIGSFLVCAFVVYIAVTGESDPRIIYCLRNPGAPPCQ